MAEQPLTRPLLLRSFRNKEESLVQKLEFYFGDPNLNFDHYLRVMIASNMIGHVILNEVLKHAGILEYRDIIISSVPRYSNFLAITPTKNFIYRTIPYVDKPAENCCIYISGISIKATYKEIYLYFTSIQGIVYIKPLRNKDTKSKFIGEVIIEFISQAFSNKFIRNSPYKFGERWLIIRESSLSDRMKLFGETIFVRNYDRPHFYTSRDHSIAVYGFPSTLENYLILNRIQKLIVGIVHIELNDYKCYAYLKERIEDEQVEILNLKTALFSQGRRLKIEKLEGFEEKTFLYSCEVNCCYFNQSKSDINEETINQYNRMRQNEGFIEEERDLRNLLLAP